MPFPIPAPCTEACEGFQDCGLLYLVEPEYPDADLCQIGCAAAHITAPDFMPDLVACAVEGLALRRERAPSIQHLSQDFCRHFRNRGLVSWSEMHMLHLASWYKGA